MQQTVIDAATNPVTHTRLTSQDPTNHIYRYRSLCVDWWSSLLVCQLAKMHHFQLFPGCFAHSSVISSFSRLSRTRRPKLTAPARESLTKAYVGLRGETLQPGGAKSARVTVRSLESLVRLSEAIAKVKLAEDVTEGHVQEALRLMQTSLMKLDRGRVLLRSREDAALDRGGSSTSGRTGADEMGAGDDGDPNRREGIHCPSYLQASLPEKSDHRYHS